MSGQPQFAGPKHTECRKTAVTQLPQFGKYMVLESWASDFVKLSSSNLSRKFNY